MPSHVVVNKLALTYKSTIGISTATIPDVCKTPSPGGPVPIPYPNFANQGSLDKGTTTVKAKGNMIAIKGSEYSMSFGDEPGTAGGVTSSTFKKETAWITYSFDVKMDGKNACRHTDKKFHNHKNTVDLAGNVDPGDPGGNPLEIKCADAPKKAGSTKFTECEKEEICAKCASINQQAKSKSGPYGGLKRIRQSAYEVNRSDGDNTCASLNRAAREGKPADLGFCPVSPKCEAELREKAEKNNYKGFSPDHIHEIQLGGHPTAESNLRWMSSAPNSWIGGEMKKYDPATHTGVKPNCC
jgi:hypothetical protein